MAILPDYIESSSQFGNSPDSERLPKVLRGRRSKSSKRNNSPETSLTLAEAPLRIRSRSPAEFVPPEFVPPVRRATKKRPRLACYIDPPEKLPSPDGRGCGLDQLKFIRLIPKRNQNRIFELRRYTFPTDKPLDMVTENHVYRPVPTQEQIVLFTSDGDVFAVLQTHDIFLGLYTYDALAMRRAKFNVVSGNVTALTIAEMEESPVGARRTIKSHFRIEIMN